MGVEINIDKAKCHYSMYDPLGCKRCLQTCGAKVFATRPAQKRNLSVPPEQRIEPTIWVLLTPRSDFCNGCGNCISVCPNEAITIKIDGNELHPW